MHLSADMRRLVHALAAPLTLIPLLCVSASGQAGNIRALADSLQAKFGCQAQAAVAAANENLTPAGSMAQIVSAGGWDTTLTLVNLGTAQGEARLNFYSDGGSSQPLPFTFPQQPSLGSVVGSTFDQAINPGATLVLDTTGPASQATAQGWSQLLTNGNIGAFAIFDYAPNGEQAVVPIEPRNAASYLLAFDNTGALSTGLAVANLATSAANIGVVIRDDTGAQIGTGTVSLPAQGHNSFMLTDPTYGFPVTANKRGTVEFDTPPNGQISVLGLRANGAAITTLPVLANVGTAGGMMAQVASGNGWQTLFTLVNTGATAANATLSFFGDDGSPLSLPLNFPQTGATVTESSVSQTLAAGATLVVVTQGLASGASVEGSAQLSTDGNVNGFAIFQRGGQEAVVPLEVGSSSSYTLPFDNTGGLATGTALANGSAQPAAVPTTLRDDTGAILGTTTIDLPGSGHTSQMLTTWFPAAANIRGTLEFDTASGVQIGALGIRATAAGIYTSIPVMTIGAAGNLMDQRALAQTGLSVALASNVLESQLAILFTSGTQGAACEAIPGGGSYASGAAPTIVVSGNPLYPVTVYYDANCTQPYIAAQFTAGTDLGTAGAELTETAVYRRLSGTNLGTMILNMTIGVSGDAMEVNGLGLFTLTTSPTPVQLGLSCGNTVSSTGLQCVGAVGQDFPALNLAIGSVTGITLTPDADDSGLTFSGGGTIYTGPIGSLNLTNPTPTSFAIPGEIAYASTTTSGSAAAMALFPPTPTAWTLTDAEHDEQIQISVISNTTRNVSVTIIQLSTGATLATGSVDQSGTGTITYSDGSSAAITSWTLAE